ncbi:hypothetical protein PQ472_00820 [Lacticaseibacillus pabuli]|uniref:DUF2933 family protein n=1 Tax=Lacticaseibacillus pabuli TaxID=3025672 RepID=A0ABY7WRK4_9LACO|nr:hypothetical protein [Lacticaseibacillus sp. KACC 23028]WDF82815.1 hypothetical protein PQ472_00820 [Lacticaseibacillus sp. KACC 23028]
MQKATLIIAIIFYLVSLIALITMHSMFAMYMMVIGMLIECGGHLSAMYAHKMH